MSTLAYKMGLDEATLLVKVLLENVNANRNVEAICTI